MDDYDRIGWRRFIESGSVESYLRFRAVRRLLDEEKPD